MSKNESAPIVWGIAGIARHIQRSERTTLRMLEDGEVPGATKLANRWILNVTAFAQAVTV
jgi:hypothetical protein